MVGDPGSAKFNFGSKQQKYNKELKNNNLLFLFICAIPSSLTKSEGRLFLVPKSSGTLLEGPPLNARRNKRQAFRFLILPFQIITNFKIANRTFCILYFIKHASETENISFNTRGKMQLTSKREII